MNNKEKLSILTAAIARAYTAIDESSGAEMKDERFRDLLFNIDRMEIEAESLNVVESTEPSQPDMPSCVSSDTGTTKESLEVPSETPAPEPEENVKPELEKEPENPGSEKPGGETFKPAEVRAALASARLKGVNVAELLRKFGAGNFSALPESRYADVMQAVKQELANAS